MESKDPTDDDRKRHLFLRTTQVETGTFLPGHSLTDSRGGERHLTELEIAGYLDRGITAPERGRIEDHLVECSECREHVSEAQKLISAAHRPRRLAAIAGIAAIAACIAIVVAPEVSQRKYLGNITRDDTIGAEISSFSPGESSSRANLRFVWATIPEAMSYRITVSTRDGMLLWTETLSDTVAILPRNIRLAAATTYVWFADAVLPDGSTRSTGMKQFRVTDATQ